MNRWLMFLTLAVFGAGATHAAPVLVPNPSFESPATTSTIVTDNWVQVNFQTYTQDAYNPFEFLGGNAFYVGANPTTDPANGGAGYPGILGSNVAVVFQGDPGYGLTQTLAATLQADTRYTLTIAEGNWNGPQAGGFLGSTIELLAGGTVVASATDNVGPAPGAFRDQTAVLVDSSAFPGLIGQPLTIQMMTTLAFTMTGQATDWDNVRLDASPVAAAVPEPATIAPAATAALIAVAYAWRRRRQNAATA